MTPHPDLLVAGAGPTGLTLALQAHAHGARVRIIDRRPTEFRPSRALIVHARTLEVLRPLGLTQPLLDRADITPEFRVHLGDRVARMRLADLALPDTAFPHVSLLRQSDVEAVLAQALAERGVPVERGTELVGARDGADAARATLRSSSGTETVFCGFIAGCDGPGSTVRTQAGIGWRGRPYAQEIVLADAEFAGGVPGCDAHVAVGRGGLVFAFPLGEQAAWRVLATRPAGPSAVPMGPHGRPVQAEALQALLDAAGLDAQVTRLAWSARIRVQRRLAARFREGRLFLAGDAAHACSPATGQGMNAGIQDAVNLGWKLAFAAPGGTTQGALLDSYDSERRAVARQIIAMTHLVFWAEAATGPVPSSMRAAVAQFGAPALPLLMRRPHLVAETVRLLSQLRVAYPASPLSVEGTPRLPGRPRAGDRLPDMAVTVGQRQIRLHELLSRPGVQVLVHRDASQAENLAFGPHVTIHRLMSMPGPGLVAVRPDGYVGFRCRDTDIPQLRTWLARVGALLPYLCLQFQSTAGPRGQLRDERAQLPGPSACRAGTSRRGGPSGFSRIPIARCTGSPARSPASSSRSPSSHSAHHCRVRWPRDQGLSWSGPLGENSTVKQRGCPPWGVTSRDGPKVLAKRAASPLPPFPAADHTELPTSGGSEVVAMRAHVGDQLVVGTERIGAVIGVPAEDGSPPYIIKWLNDGHIAMVQPDHYARIIPATQPTNSSANPKEPS